MNSYVGSPPVGHLPHDNTVLDQLQVTVLSGGMTIWYGSECLDILSNSGYELKVADVFGAHFINSDWPYISHVGQILDTRRNDTLAGTRLMVARGKMR